MNFGNITVATTWNGDASVNGSGQGGTINFGGLTIANNKAFAYTTKLTDNNTETVDFGNINGNADINTGTLKVNAGDGTATKGLGTYKFNFGASGFANKIEISDADDKNDTYQLFGGVMSSATTLDDLATKLSALKFTWTQGSTNTNANLVISGISGKEGDINTFKITSNESDTGKSGSLSNNTLVFAKDSGNSALKAQISIESILGKLNSGTESNIEFENDSGQIVVK